jgi:hypothetical protein
MRRGLIAVAFGLEIERDGALVGGLGKKRSPELCPVERLIGAVAATLIGLVGMLDLDHIGTQHCQLVGRKRSRQHMREVDHPDAFERSRHRLTPCRIVVTSAYRYRAAAVGKTHRKATAHIIGRSVVILTVAFL